MITTVAGNPQTGYFHGVLHRFLTAYHPDLSNDIVYINNKCTIAAEIFETARLEGSDVFSALSEANKYLLGDLESSPFLTLKTLIENNYPQLSSPIVYRIALSLLPEGRRITARFQQEDNIESDSPAYYTAYQMELLGLIEENILRYGI